MAVHVVGAVLGVVLGDEDRRVLPVRGVRDLVDDLADGEVVVGDLRLRVGRSTGVVAGEPHHVEVGRAVLLEVLLPGLVAVDVRDGQVERRGVRVRDRVQRRDGGTGVQLQRRGEQRGGVTAGHDALGRAVVLLPGGAGGLAFAVLELAEVLRALARGLDGVPQEPAPLVTEHILLGVVRPRVLAGTGLGVGGVVALHQPVVALRGVRPDVVRVVVQAELGGEGVLVRRDLRAELGERRRPRCPASCRRRAGRSCGSP